MESEHDLPYGTEEIHSSAPNSDKYATKDEYIKALEEYIADMERDWLEVRNCDFGSTRFVAVAAAEQYVGEHPHKYRPQEFC